ncbi:MAG: hsdS [Bacteroidetes bacterium]|nr:hsdS [Bacteroidota bacterium]
MEKNVPILRFPDFKDSYTKLRLSEILIRHSENNKDEEFKIDDILSLSSTYGIVNRKELLEDTYEKVNHLAYIKTRYNDFVYGKSISSNYPFGLFKANKCRDGLLSTLYFTFKVQNNALPDYLDRYFSHLNRANNFLRKYVLVGDRYITADSDFLLSGEISIPSLPEQTKIANFLTAVGDKISQLKKKKELLEQYKKGVMQKIFSQELRFKDENGEDFAEWEEATLIEIAERITTKNKENNQNVLTISAQIGLISQIEFFSKSVSAKDVTGYYLLHRNDFAYNKSYSKGYPVGAVKRLNKYPKGVVSTLYICFRFNELVDLGFMEHYFDSGLHNSEIEKIAQEGARNHGLLNIDVKDFFNTRLLLPSLPEQTKIANFLSAIDDKISHCGKQIEGMERWDIARF